ncbi:hypothetical protein AAD018_005980 [Aestuariibius insulae]|uniref:hypothetical protein n=1 Tax=Aestuariibius insulae TaxID=2058287 RepID=UPI00345E6679
MAKFDRFSKQVEAAFDAGKPLDNTSSPIDALEETLAYVKMRGFDPYQGKEGVSVNAVEVREYFVKEILSKDLPSGPNGEHRRPQDLTHRDQLSIELLPGGETETAIVPTLSESFNYYRKGKGHTAPDAGRKKLRRFRDVETFGLAVREYGSSSLNE